MCTMLMTRQCVQKVQHGKHTAHTQCFPVPSLYPKAIYNHLSFIHSLTHSFTSRVHKAIKQPTGCAVIKHLQEKDTQNNCSRWNLANLLELPQTFFTSASRPLKTEARRRGWSCRASAPGLITVLGPSEP